MRPAAVGPSHGNYGPMAERAARLQWEAAVMLAGAR
jgi:predicted dienelactone hydrolase